MRPFNHLEHAWRLWLTTANPWFVLTPPVQQAPEVAQRPEMVHRSEDGLPRVEVAPPPSAPLAATMQARRPWLGRLLDRLEAGANEREARARDAYLAEATTIADLEQRMRDYDRAAARRDRDRLFGFGMH